MKTPLIKTLTITYLTLLLPLYATQTNQDPFIQLIDCTNQASFNQVYQAHKEDIHKTMKAFFEDDLKAKNNYVKRCQAGTSGEWAEIRSTQYIIQQLRLISGSNGDQPYTEEEIKQITDLIKKRANKDSEEINALLQPTSYKGTEQRLTTEIRSLLNSKHGNYMYPEKVNEITASLKEEAKNITDKKLKRLVAETIINLSLAKKGSGITDEKIQEITNSFKEEDHDIKKEDWQLLVEKTAIAFLLAKGNEGITNEKIQETTNSFKEEDHDIKKEDWQLLVEKTAITLLLAKSERVITDNEQQLLTATEKKIKETYTITLTFDNFKRFIANLMIEFYIYFYLQDDNVGLRVNYRFSNNFQLGNIWQDYPKAFPPHRKSLWLRQYIKAQNELANQDSEDEAQKTAICTQAYVEALGPIMQKVTQKCIASTNLEIHPPNACNLIKRAWQTSSSSKFAPSQSEKTFLHTLFPDNSTITPLGQASVARVVKVTHQGKDYAVKYIKASINQASIETEHEELKKLYFYKGLTKIEIDSLAEKAKQEINLAQEKKNMQDASTIYQGAPGVEIVKLAEEANPNQKPEIQYIIMELVKGDPLNKTLQQIKDGEKDKKFIQALKQSLENLQINWYHQFYCNQAATLCHADLNTGNIMVDETGKVTMIDFGYMLPISAPISKKIDNKPLDVHGNTTTTVKKIYAQLKELIESKGKYTKAFNKKIVDTILPIIELKKPVEKDGKAYNIVECLSQRIIPYEISFLLNQN
ncbi:MAG: AarF/UbiB family protein, partial [Bacteroidota bacterium]